jgi:hypothetical protein
VCLDVPGSGGSRARDGAYGTGAGEFGRLSAWLRQHAVVEAVMESTAHYCKPVWMELEPHLRLHLAQAYSNKAPKGRKTDLADAKRLVRRFAAGELMLSFIPEPKQRDWRMIMPRIPHKPSRPRGTRRLLGHRAHL